MMARIHTLEKQDHRLPAFTLDNPLDKLAQARLRRASAEIGEECEWRFHGETEVMDVSF